VVAVIGVVESPGVEEEAAHGDEDTADCFAYFEGLVAPRGFDSIAPTLHLACRVQLFVVVHQSEGIQATGARQSDSCGQLIAIDLTCFNWRNGKANDSWHIQKQRKASPASTPALPMDGSFADTVTVRPIASSSAIVSSAARVRLRSWPRPTETS